MDSNQESTEEQAPLNVVETFDDDGNLIAKQSFEKGLLQGESFKYDQFQKVTEKLTYQAGKLDGPAEFYKNGIPLFQSHFVNGKQTGEAIFYDEAGVVSARVQFVGGLKQGAMASYDPLGRIRQIHNYAQDILEGPMTAYYPNGSLMESGNYVQGQKQGEFISYYENGIVRQILVYNQGRMTAPPQFFDINGYPLPRGVEP